MREYKPMEWPYKAKEARDGAAEKAASALKLVLDVTEQETDVSKLRKLSKAANNLQDALRHLEGVGAQTRPAAQ